MVEPSTEACDGIDNDCDGSSDEDSIPADERDCSTGRAGVCGAGTRRCVDGRPQCVQNVQPGIELTDVALHPDDFSFQAVAQETAVQGPFLAAPALGIGPVDRLDSMVQQTALITEDA